VTVQTLTIVVRLVESELFGHRLEVVDLEMPESAELGFHPAKHRVISVTGITGFASRDAIILEVRGGNVGLIVVAQTFSVGLHGMAGETKVGGFGLFEMNRRTQSYRGDRQNKQRDKGKNLAASYRRERRSNDQQTDKNNAENNENRNRLVCQRLISFGW
jgi:hypothetical protein